MSPRDPERWETIPPSAGAVARYRDVAAADESLNSAEGEAFSEAPNRAGGALGCAR